MNILVQRNLKLFYKNRSAMFYALFSVLILVGMYALFLGRLLVQATEGAPGGEALTISWLIAGLVGIGGIGGAMQGIFTMVADKESKADRLFLVAPISRGYLVRGYMASTLVIAFAVPLVTFMGMSLYLWFLLGSLPFTMFQVAQALGVMVLSSLSCTAVVNLIASTMKDPRSFSTASSIINTLAGFIMGVYIPMGTLPVVVQQGVMLFPPSHVVVMLRQILMRYHLEATFLGAPGAYRTELEHLLGIEVSLFGLAVTPVVSVSYLLATTAGLYAISVWLTNRRGK